MDLSGRAFANFSERVSLVGFVAVCCAVSLGLLPRCSFSKPYLVPPNCEYRGTLPHVFCIFEELFRTGSAPEGRVVPFWNSFDPRLSSMYPLRNRCRRVMCPPWTRATRPECSVESLLRECKDTEQSCPRQWCYTPQNKQFLGGAAVCKQLSWTVHLSTRGPSLGDVSKDGPLCDFSGTYWTEAVVFMQQVPDRKSVV